MLVVAIAVVSKGSLPDQAGTYPTTLFTFVFQNCRMIQGTESGRSHRGTSCVGMHTGGIRGQGGGPPRQGTPGRCGSRPGFNEAKEGENGRVRVQGVSGNKYVFL